MRIPVFRHVLVLTIWFAVATFGFAGAAQSRNLSFVVVTENGNSDFVKCGLSNGASKASVEAALRYNRNLIVKENPDIYAYISVTTLPLIRGSVFTGTCATMYILKFQKFITDAELKLPDNKIRMTTAEYCMESGLVVDDKLGSQTAISDSLKNLVDKCMSEIDKYVVE